MTAKQDDQTVRVIMNGVSFITHRHKPKDLLVELLVFTLDPWASLSSIRSTSEQLHQLTADLMVMIPDKDWRRPLARVMKTTEIVSRCDSRERSLIILYNLILSMMGMGLLPRFYITGAIEKGNLYYNPEHRSIMRTY